MIDSPAAVFCNVRCAPFCDGADGEKRVDTQGRGDRGAVNYIQAHTSRGGRQCQNCRKTTVLCGCIPPTKHRRPSSNHPTDEWCLVHRGRTLSALVGLLGIPRSTRHATPGAPPPRPLSVFHLPGRLARSSMVFFFVHVQAERPRDHTIPDGQAGGLFSLCPRSSGGVRVCLRSMP